MQAVSVLIALMAVTVATVQTILSRRAAQGALMADLLDKFWDDDNRAARRTVGLLHDKPMETWSEDEIRAAERVAHQLSLVGFVIKNSYAPRRAFLDYWGVRAIKAYQVLEPFVVSRRATEDAPDQWVDFEWLARSGCAHFRRRTTWWNGSRWARLRVRTSPLSLNVDG